MKKLFIRLKTTIASFVKTDSALRVLSAVIAVIAWLFVTMTIHPTDEQIIAGIPVKIDLEGSAASILGLTDVDISATNVTATIEGKRMDIMGMKSANLTAVVNVDNVTNPAKYRLEYEIVSSDDVEFTVLKTDPPYITVEFDKIVTKEVPVMADISAISAGEGFLTQTAQCVPETVTLTGPAQEVNKVEKCTIKASAANKLTDTFKYTTTDFKLSDKNNFEVGISDNVEMSNNSFEVTVPVYIEKEVSLKFVVMNKPEYFDTDNLEYDMSVESILIAAPVGENYDGNIGYINMQDIDLGYSKTFDIILPEGYLNLSDVNTVTVTFPTEGYARRTINTGIRLVNFPENYNVTPVHSGFSIVYIGPSDEVAALSSYDVVAVIDMRNYDIQEGLNTGVPVTVVIPNNEKIWSYGTYTATVKATEITE